MARSNLKQVENAAQDAADAPIPGAVEELVLNQQDPADLDTLFNDLETELEAVALTLPPADDAHTESDHIAAGRHINTEELRAKALEELEENATPVPDEARAPKAQPAKKPPATKRISTLGLSTSAALAQGLGSKLDELLTLDANDFALSEEDSHTKRHDLMAAIDVLPKKIGEKVVNLYAHISKGATLSTYTRIAIDLLVKDGEITSKSLKDLYIARPYSEGTASSQATQMMKLLPTLGLAIRSAGKITLNENSLLMPMLTTPAAE